MRRCGVLPSVPDMPDSPSVARELAAHSQALRSLARDLVGSADADDLVQDTAVRALRSPPPSPTGLFAWFATVMRNLAANRARGEQRRRRREGANAADLEVPCASSEVAHRDSVRAMTDALWRLPEPYQSTLVQRYFQGLSPAAIAARAAVPLPTVKSRLQRGLDLLRAALAARDGRDWRASLVPAFGLPTGPSWFLPLLSVSSMSTFTKSVVAAAACAVAAFTLWAVAANDAPPPSFAAQPANDAVAAVAIAPGEEPRTVDRAAVAREVAGELATAQPFAFELRCRVVDADGLPFEGGNVALAPPGCALGLSEPMDDDGRVTITWRARVPTLAMAVGFAFQGAHTSLQHVTLTAGTPAEVSFVAGVAPLPVQVRVDELGRQVVTTPDCSQGQSDCRSCHEGMTGASVFAVRGELRAGLHPDAVFGDRLVIAPPAPAGPDLVLHDMNGILEWNSDASVAPPTTNRAIEGRVFGADGKPLVGVRANVRGSGFSSTVRTEADGSFRLPWHGPADQPVEFRAGGGAEGRVVRKLDAVGEPANLGDLLLDTGRTLRGRAVDANGKALNGARVEYIAPPGHDGDVATVGPDGVFAFANLPPGPGRLLLWGVKGELLPIAVEPSVLPDGGDVAFDLRQRPATNGSVRLFVRRHDGEPANDLEVRVWQRDTQRGAFLTRREDGAFHAHGITAGFYRVEVGALATGWRDLGEHWVDGAGLADLGTVQLATPAQLRIETDADLTGFELYARRADLDVRADVVTAASRELLLPPGRWLAMWLHEGKKVTQELVLSLGAPAVLRTAPR
jgi:RNA polymerase sigma factor (sigma-70 family)